MKSETIVLLIIFIAISLLLLAKVRSGIGRVIVLIVSVFFIAWLLWTPFLVIVPLIYIVAGVIIAVTYIKRRQGISWVDSFRNWRQRSEWREFKLSTREADKDAIIQNGFLGLDGSPPRQIATFDRWIETGAGTMSSSTLAGVSGVINTSLEPCYDVLRWLRTMLGNDIYSSSINGILDNSCHIPWDSVVLQSLNSALDHINIQGFEPWLMDSLKLCAENASREVIVTEEEKRNSLPSSDLPPDWEERRKKVLDRDGYQCVICHARFTEGVSANVHHIKERSMGGSHEYKNLISLCYSCHACMSGHDVMSKPGFILDAYSQMVHLENCIYAPDAPVVQDYPRGYHNCPYCNPYETGDAVAHERYLELRKERFPVLLHFLAAYPMSENIKEWARRQVPQVCVYRISERPKGNAIKKSTIQAV